MYRLQTIYFFFIIAFITACNTQKHLVSSTQTVPQLVKNTLLADTNFAKAHLGICIYNATDSAYLYQYQSEKFFVPASNMKLFTCYAAMKHLGDSLVGLRYVENKDNIIIQGTGDPTLLVSTFNNHPVFDFLQNTKKEIQLDAENWNDNRFGKGWAWDDFGDDYCVERSSFPIYGNLLKFFINQNAVTYVPFYKNDFLIDRYSNKVDTTLPYLHLNNLPKKFSIIRSSPHSNTFSIVQSSKPFLEVMLPKQIDEFENLAFLKDTLFHTKYGLDAVKRYHFFTKNNFTKKLHSQPTDSLLKPMMHNSDNFFAEQTLLMISNEQLGVMNDENIIDTLLKTDFKQLPQKPKWVDGSGLSRYNLVSPQDLVWVLTQMKKEFSWQRITDILPTGNEGTLKNYYKHLDGKIFAKTGTLSNQVALSGYLITKQNKTFIFSILVNNHQTSASTIRKGVEQFLTSIYERY